MIRDLDDTLRRLLIERAPQDSELASSSISFDIPDEEWRGDLDNLTVNCYLYDTQQNTDLKTSEPILQRMDDGIHAIRRRPPARIDCAYCITAWSPAKDESVLDEHRLLSQVLLVLLKHPVIPQELLEGELVNQIPPYPTVIATTNGVKNLPEFWRALDQQYKPSLNYIVTLAMLLDEVPEQPTRIVDDVDTNLEHKTKIL